MTILLTHVSSALAETVNDRITVSVRGKGPDVVLVPGLACSSAVWDTTAKRLEGHYRLHIVQVAGFAGSPARANASGAVVPATTEAIHAYIKTNHLKSAKLIGHSLGGVMGMILAINHPEDISKLMLVESLPFFGALTGAKDASEAAPQAAAMRNMILAQPDFIYAQSEKEIVRTLVKSAEGRKLAASWAIASDRSVVARTMYEAATTDLRPELHKIKAPLTVLYGWDKQASFPRADIENFYRMSFASVPGAKVSCVEGAFHFIMLDQPAKFGAEVESFLKR